MTLSISKATLKGQMTRDEHCGYALTLVLASILVDIGSILTFRRMLFARTERGTNDQMSGSSGSAGCCVVVGTFTP